MNTESDVIEAVTEEVEKLTSEPVASEEAEAPQLTEEQVAAQEKMKLITAEVGNAYIQDAARLLANIAGTVGVPLSFAYNTQSGGKALVFAVSGDAEEVRRLAAIVDASLRPSAKKEE